MDRHAYMQAYWADYRKRKKTIKFWVSPAIDADLKRLAIAEGKRQAVVARELMEAALNADARIPRQLEMELRELNRLIKNIANNINQQTRYAHEQRQGADPIAMLAHLKKLHDHVAAFTRREMRKDQAQDP